MFIAYVAYVSSGILPWIPLHTVMAITLSPQLVRYNECLLLFQRTYSHQGPPILHPLIIMCGKQGKAKFKNTTNSSIVYATIFI
jgi:hypothetical protein